MKSKNILLNHYTDKDTKKVIFELFVEEFIEKLSSIEQLPGGANSIVYKVMTTNNYSYLAKKYLVREGDNRDRLSTEYFGISFLWNNGVRFIPEPIYLNKNYNIGIYRFIDGKKLNPEEIKFNDIYLAANFLGSMHALINVEDANKQPVASEACFSIKAYIDCIDRRLKNLKKITKKNDVFELLHNFLDNEFIHLFREVKHSVKGQAQKKGVDIDMELGKHEKILSPSDFGFHNAIKTNDGILFFIDFEYYGWDDPAKLICDYYLQPAIPLPYKYRKIFLERVCRYLGNDIKLKKRLPYIYLLLSLKWCLIMLNVFITFSGNTEIERLKILKQLEKAKNKFKKAKYEYEIGAFPIYLNWKEFH